MRHFLILSFAFLSSALAAPLVVTPATQQVPPGGLVILSASEEVNWFSSGGALGSMRGTRIVLEAPRTGGNVTITIQDPKDASRKAFAVVQVAMPATNAIPWRVHTFAAGASFSTAISADGSLWTWGLNDKFQVPSGKAGNVLIPVRAEGLSGLVSVGAAKFLDVDNAGITLAKNGTLWLWGRSHKNPSAVDKNVMYADYSTCLVVSSGDGTFAVSEGNGRRKNDYRQIAYVTSGYRNSTQLAISQNGNVLVSGECGRGLNVVDGLKDAVDITPVGDDVDIVLKQDGSVVLLKTSESPVNFQELAGFSNVRIIGSSSRRGGGGWGFVVMKDNTVRGFELDDSNIPSVPKPVAGLSDIIDVSVSGSHALFLRKDGTLFAIGLNDNGELGNGTTQDSSTPVEVVGLKVMLPPPR